MYRLRQQVERYLI